MTLNSSRGRVALVATVAGALVAGAAGTAPAVGAPSHDPRSTVLSTFAKQTLGGTGSTGRPRADQDASTSSSSKEAQPAPRTDDTLTAAPQALAAAVDCSSLGIAVTQTQNHSHLTWEAVAGASSITVKRERFGGTATTLASGLPGTTTSYDDLVQNPMGLVAYHVDAVVAGTTTSCRTPESDYWSMSTDDGVGFADVMFAGTDKVWEQDTVGPAAPAWTTAASRPAFSPTGRLVAAVEQVGGVWALTVRKAANGALQWSVPAPTGIMLDEPSFSPDGQRIVAEALDLAGLPNTVVSTGLYTIPVNTTTHPLTPVPSSAGLATADWVDTPNALTSTTIIAADLATPGGLLTLVDAASGARTSVPGTEGALDPMGQADGSILFTTLGATEATLNLRSATGVLSRIQTWTDSTARWPVADPDTGKILVYLEVPDTSTPDVPDDYVWSVSTVDPANAGYTEATGIGHPRSGDDVGFNGFDLRTPFSAGTSNFGGAANGDILARDTLGQLWAYPLSASTTSFFDKRHRLATGWSTVKQFIAAGDLNSDRRGDIVTVDSAGVLWLYPGKGSFLLGPRSRMGSGWASYAIFATGDVNGDTRADIIARDSGGVLWLYPGNGRGGLNSRTQIGKGWSVFNAIIGPGDWNYDGNPDLMARDRATGYLYLYPGKGNGTFGARKYLGRGWNSRTAFAAPELYAGVNALFARTTTGVLLDYDSVGDGVMSGSAVYQVSTGWNPYTING